MNRKLISLSVLIVWLMSGIAAAQVAANDEMALTREIIQTERKAILIATMQLSDADSELFWPIYREYREAMNRIGDRSVALITSYSDQYANLTDADAKDLIDEHLKIEDEKVKIRKKFVKKFSKVLPSKTVMRWVQSENKMDAVMNMEMAAEIPLAR